MKTCVVCLIVGVCMLFGEALGGVVEDYPSKSLQCYSSLTKPDKELICPASRANYCVKEVVSTSENLCGQTQYFGDEYKDGICQFKKCSAQCVEGVTNFEYQGERYTRTRYCCNNVDMCNSGSRNMISLLSVGMTLLISTLSLFL